MSDVRHVRYTGRAARYLQMLQDLGHLEGDMSSRIAVTAAELYGHPRAALIDLPQIRRVVALVLFESGTFDGALASPLDEDWPMLFH